MSTNAEQTADGGIKAVIFDAGGVLITSPFIYIGDYLQKLGLDRDTMRKLFMYTKVDSPMSRWERGEIVGTNKLDQLYSDYCFEMTGIRADWNGFSEEMVRLLTASQPLPEMVNCILRLRSAGYKTALLTNNGYLTEGELWRPDPICDHNHFDVIVESAVEHIRKPDPRIFQLTLDKLEVEANAAVFLDDLQENVDGARQLGIRAIKVTSTEQALKELEAMIGIPLQS